MKRTVQDLEAEIARLKAENEALQIKATNYELTRSEAILWEMACQLPLGLAYHDPATDVLVINYYIENLIGYENSKVNSSAAWFRLLHTEAEHQDTARYQEALTLGASAPLLFSITTALEDVKMVELSIVKIGSRAVWIVTDKTEEVKSQKAQVEAEALYQTLVHSLPDGLVVTQKASITYANPALARMLGYDSPQELIGMFGYDIIHSDYQAEIRMRVRALDAGFPVALNNIKLVRKDGTPLDVQVLGIRHKIQGVLGSITVVRDMSGQIAIQKRLEAGTEIFTTFMKQIPALAWIKDTEGRYIYGNHTWQDYLQKPLDELLHKTDFELATPERAELIARQEQEVLVTGTPVQYLLTLPNLKNSRRILDVIKFPIPVGEGTSFLGGLAVDVTERHQLEEQFLQAQKMESIGRLAGGVAHDFNNLLTAIIGYGDMLKESLPQSDKRQYSIEQILKAANRASDMTRKLLTFARRQIIEARPLDINELLHNLFPILRRLIGEDVEIHYTAHQQYGMVKADPGQLEQVFMNLIVNARDALPQGGSIYIDTRIEALSPDFSQSVPDLPPGEYICISVRDTGVGMPPETLSHLFEPYFTTKDIGKGTGLGLATCHGIMKQFGGHISVYSEIGMGTTFTLLLPIMNEPVQESVPVEQPAPPPTGKERILLVEDEELIRNMARQTLERQGYVVVTATNGQEAVEQYAERIGDFDLVLTDVVMPHLSGKQMVDQFLAQGKPLRVLFMSGYTESAIVHHGVLENSIALLNKPFTPATLVHRVRAVLDAVEK
jgi:PAS domain S-box-containing protein